MTVKINAQEIIFLDFQTTLDRVYEPRQLPLAVGIHIRGRRKPGDWIVQNAANGLIGKLVARFGAERGIKVLGLVRRQEAVEELRALGIDNVIATDGEGWADKAKALTGGAPVLRAIDSLGGDGAAQVLKVASDDAVLWSFGAMTEQPLKIAAQDLLFRGITVKGFWGAKPHVSPQRIGSRTGKVSVHLPSGRSQCRFR